MHLNFPFFLQVNTYYLIVYFFEISLHIYKYELLYLPPIFTKKCNLYIPFHNVLFFTHHSWRLFHIYLESILFNYMEYNLLNHSPIEGPLCWLQAFTITNCSTKNNLEHKSFQICESNMWNKFAEVESQNQEVYAFVIDSQASIDIVNCPTHTPTSKLLTAPLTEYLTKLLAFCQSTKWKLVS